MGAGMVGRGIGRAPIARPVVGGETLDMPLQ
jgi:hypothetical protein